MILVEKNIPIPAKEHRGAAKYPWGEMEVGDSFFIEGAKKTLSISAASTPYGRRHNKKFTARKVDGGVRVWRIE